MIFLYNTYDNMRCCRNINNTLNYPSYEIQNPGDDRFFLAPFLVGGLAGTALGYGLANNNQLNHQGGYYPQPIYPIPMPYYPCCGNNYNNFYR